MISVLLVELTAQRTFSTSPSTQLLSNSGLSGPYRRNIRKKSLAAGWNPVGLQTSRRFGPEVQIHRVILVDPHPVKVLRGEPDSVDALDKALGLHAVDDDRPEILRRCICRDPQAVETLRSNRSPSFVAQGREGKGAAAET